MNLSMIRKAVVIGCLAMIGLGVMQSGVSASADGDLDISTLPPQAQWRINPGQAAANPVVKVVIVKQP